jgi:hypothetical protein
MFTDVIATSRETSASTLFESDSQEPPSTSPPSAAPESSDSQRPRKPTINIPGAIPTKNHEPQSQESPSLSSLPSDGTVIEDADEAKQQAACSRSLDRLENWTTPAKRNWSPPFPLKPPPQKRALRYGRAVAEPVPATETPTTKSPLESCFYGKAELPIGVCVGDYQIVRPLSQQGGHGLVVLAAQKDTGNLYAMKIARDKSSMSGEARVHSKITQRLKDVDELRIPRLHAVYKECTKEITVMDALGPSLQDLWQAIGAAPDYYLSSRGAPFSTKTCVQLALELLATYEQLHSVGYVHLTTKPENFCIGGTKETQGRIYMVDFGRTRGFLRKDGSHAGDYPLAQQVMDIYASIWNAGNRAASRRDDLMSITLMVIHMALGKAPWEKNRKKKVRKGKEGKGFTKKDWIDIVVKGHRSKKLSPFEEMMAHIAGLAYTDVPDYQLLRGIWHKYAKKKRISLDGVYDWDHLLQVNEDGFIDLLKGKEKPKRSCSI